MNNSSHQCGLISYSLKETRTDGIAKKNKVKSDTASSSHRELESQFLCAYHLYTWRLARKRSDMDV